MWKGSLAVMPGVGVSLLPKLMCPMCWPAYAGLVSALGLGFLISTKYLLPLTVAFLATTAAALGFRASQRHGYGPLWLGLLAATVILMGKFYFDVPQAAYIGVGLLIAASVWNSWPPPCRYNARLPCVRFSRGGFQRKESRRTHT
jgi:hypothetical protein